MQLCRTLSLTLVCVATMTADVDAQETASDTLLTVDHFLDWERVGDPQLSPNGSQIVFARRHVNQIEDRWDSELWIMNADGSRKRFLTKGSSPRWSLDGTRIAYLAQGEPSGTQVFVRWMDDEGATSQITRDINQSAGSGSRNITTAYGTGKTLHLTERISRTAEDTLLYQYTVTGPVTFARPFTVEVPMRRGVALFEYACHEGNYAMIDILAGARAEEQAARSSGSTR